MTSTKQKQWLPYLMVLPAMTIMAVVVVLPICSTVIRSFRTADGQFTWRTEVQML